MAQKHNEAYRLAEQKIEAARQSGATELNLSVNWHDKEVRLTEVPESLSQLTQLESLDLSHNALTSLPDWLGQLTQLRLLSVHNNMLTSLPESLGLLTELHKLELWGNRLTSLPSSLSNLRHLERLYLDNPIGEVPSWLRHLIRLETLAIANSQLKHLPDWIGELQNLRTLYLGRNHLTDLPESLAQLERLERLKLDGNPLNPELAAANQEGLEAVRRYLRAKAEGGQIVLNEAKLILVGEGEVGKSCLLGALRGDPWE